MRGCWVCCESPESTNAWWSREPLPFAERTTGKELVLQVGDTWGELFDCAWFQFCGEIPPLAAGQHVVLLLDVNGEMCVYDAQGTPVRGLTRPLPKEWNSELMKLTAVPSRSTTQR